MPAAIAGVRVLEHFQEKWNPVFRPKMRQFKNARAVSISIKCETALAAQAVVKRSNTH
jgi:hypothetical protein